MGCTESRKERRLNHVPVGACVRYIFFCVFICCYNLDDKSVRDSALTPRNPAEFYRNLGNLLRIY